MNPEDKIIYMFYGEVVLLAQHFSTAKYLVLLNGIELEIDNSMHIRLVENQMNLPYSFYIIAPIIAIRYPIKGEIPSQLIIEKPASYYIQLRIKHHGE